MTLVFFYWTMSLRTLIRKIKQTVRPVLVTRRGEPVALNVPAPEPEKPKNWLGIYAEKGRIVDDIISPAEGPEDWEVLNEGDKCTISAWEK